MKQDINIQLDKNKIYEILKEILKKYKVSLKSETYGIEKINFDDILNIEEILDLILNDERKGIRQLPYIDLSNVDFKDQDITYIDFTNTNAKLNPQTVKRKDHTHAILNGIDYKGCIWDGTRLSFTNFEGTKNVNLNPQTVMYPSLYGCILKGIDFKDKSFKGVGLEYTDLRGAHNVIIYEKEVWNKDLSTTLFDEKATIIRESQIEFEEQKIKQLILEKTLNQVPKRI